MEAMVHLEGFLLTFQERMMTKKRVMVISTDSRDSREVDTSIIWSKLCALFIIFSPSLA